MTLGVPSADALPREGETIQWGGAWHDGAWRMKRLNMEHGYHAGLGCPSGAAEQPGRRWRRCLSRYRPADKAAFWKAEDELIFFVGELSV